LIKRIFARGLLCKVSGNNCVAEIYIMRYNAFYWGICLCLSRCFLLHHAAGIAKLGGIRDRQLAQTNY
jgi:hypothetical protein